MLVLLKDNWKLVISIAYAVIVPLYFNQTSKSAVKAMEASQESSNTQITLLKKQLDEQREQYNKMFEEYKTKMAEAQAKYDEELEKIKKDQKKQQKRLTDTFKNDESAIDEELQKRFGLTR
jgi:Tfp pilus assembly major pilin PilA